MARPRQFEGLNDVDAATARRRFRILRVDAGAEVVEDPGAGRSLMCLVEGELEVRVGEAVLAVVHAGSLVGETAIFDDVGRSANVFARTPCLIWALDRKGYEELRDTLHPVCRNLEVAAIAEQVVRLHEAGDRVAALALGASAAIPKPPSGFFAAVRRLFGGGGERAATGDVRACLRRSHLFEEAPEPVRDALAERFVTLRVDGGTFLCTEGERGYRMFLLDEGVVDVVVSSGEEVRVVSTLEPGAAFGMVSLVSDAPRMASVVARGEVLVHVLDMAVWQDLSGDVTMVGSSFRRAMIRALSEQLRHSNAQLSRAIADGTAEAIDGARAELG